MDYRTLGRSGCAVSTLTLGTMTFGNETDEAGSHEQLDTFMEAGGNLVDTADVYTAGASEEIIGRWLAKSSPAVRDSVVLATKGRFPLGDAPDVNRLGLSRRHLQRALDDSLRRLGTECVDLYQVHSWDPVTPLEETSAPSTTSFAPGRCATSGCRTTPAGRCRRRSRSPASTAGSHP